MAGHPKLSACGFACARCTADGKATNDLGSDTTQRQSPDVETRLKLAEVTRREGSAAMGRDKKSMAGRKQSD